MAELKFKKIVLDEQLDAAIEQQDYKLASELKQQIDQAKQDLNTLIEKPLVEIEYIKETFNDADTIIKCLNILIATLNLPNIEHLTPTLRTLKDDFIDLFSENKDSEVYWRYLKCIILYSLIDRKIALDNIKTIYTPVSI